VANKQQSSYNKIYESKELNVVKIIFSCKRKPKIELNKKNLVQIHSRHNNLPSSLTSASNFMVGNQHILVVSLSRFRKNLFVSVSVNYTVG
jgi:hypothetical protein